MKKSVVYLFLLGLILVMTAAVSASEESISPTLVAQGNSIDSFVPSGWKLIKKTSGDLNKDGLEDIAGVIEFVKTDQMYNEAPPRILFIAFKDQDIYHLSAQTDKAIWTSDMCGLSGDPLKSISVDRGSILIKLYFRNNDYSVGENIRFRFQNNDWYLIGATSYLREKTEEEFTEDYNLLTGIMIRTTIDRNGKKQEETINRGKRELLNLLNFEALTAHFTEQF